MALATNVDLQLFSNASGGKSGSTTAGDGRFDVLWMDVGFHDGGLLSPFGAKNDAPAQRFPTAGRIPGTPNDIPRNFPQQEQLNRRRF